MKRLIALLACVLGLGMIAPAVASAATTRETVPFQATIVGCSGERVRVSGQLLLISQFTEDPNGGFHDVFVLVPTHVMGVSSSGLTYRVVGGDRSTFQVSGRGTLTFTNTDQFMIISQDGEDQLLIRFTFHVTVTATGETTTVVDKFSAKCVG
jgi:hypothetical protein